MKLIKQLSANDVGQTGSHQVGILVPKFGGYLRFFPALAKGTLNPSVMMEFSDSRDTWAFRFVYYNNKLFGGTRNEYRLTRMTNFMRATGAKAGDGLVLSKHDSQYSIQLMRNALNSPPMPVSGRMRLTFDVNWKLVEE